MTTPIARLAALLHDNGCINGHSPVCGLHRARVRKAFALIEEARK